MAKLDKCLHNVASAHVTLVSLVARDPICVLTLANTTPKLFCITTWLCLLQMGHTLHPHKFPEICSVLLLTIFEPSSWFHQYYKNHKVQVDSVAKQNNISDQITWYLMYNEPLLQPKRNNCMLILWDIL